MAWQSASAMICPAECVWCERPITEGIFFCEECLPLFVSNYYRCQRCASPLPTVVPNHSCSRCTTAKWKFTSVVTLGPYRGRLREAVILMKKKRYDLLRRGVARLMAAELQSAFAATSPVLVAVPNHWTRTFARSHCQAFALAQTISLETGWPLLTNVVRRSRKTAKQGMLSWTERTKNVRGAFQIRTTQKLGGRHAIVVDDVLTSGATADEIAKLLLAGGAARVSVAVAARGTGARESVTQAASATQKQIS
jgi:ComF family protein